MAEANAKVSLTNLMDRLQASVRSDCGPFVIRSVSLQAVFKPGEVYSRISPLVARSLGVEELRKHEIRRTDQSGKLEVIVVPLQFESYGRTTVDEAVVLGEGEEVLIGRTVLNKLDLVVDERGTVMPNPSHHGLHVVRV